MRIVCRHGYFSFYPEYAEEIGHYNSIFNAGLVRVEDYYTFEALSELPRWSILGLQFGNLPAIKTYEGRYPWHVMRENEFVYSVKLGHLVPKASITQAIEPAVCDFYFISPTPLLQPGSKNQAGDQILSYDGQFNQKTNRLKITEVAYE